MRQHSMASLVMGVWVGAVIVPLSVRAEAAGQSTRATAQSSGATVQGAIIAVNLDKSRLQLRESDGRIVTLPIDPAAKITREGRASSLQDLSVGQTISVQQAHRNGQSIATSIDVLPGGAAPAAQTPDSGLQAMPNAQPHAGREPGMRPSDSMSGPGAAGQQPDAAAR